jgi:hypothetical protein
MKFTDEEINTILDRNFITYEYFELTQMMLIKDMLKRVLVDYYGIGYKDGLEADRELEELKSLLNNYIGETR